MKHEFATGASLSVITALVLSACQTFDDSPTFNKWSSAPLVPASQYQSQADRTGGTPLLANTRAGETTVIEGSGRFIGEPPTGTVKSSAQPAAEDGITLNLVGVPAAQAAKTILGDILSLKYIVDPKIDGKITIQTPKPVPRSEVIDLFQSALRANNAVIVSNDGVYRVVPQDQAIVGSSVQADDTFQTGQQIGSSVQVVQLKYVSASEIRRVLEPIAPRGGIVGSDDARNLITLSGNRQEIATMMEVITLFDVDVMKGMSFALIPVNTLRPEAIASELKTIFASEREGPLAGMVRFLPNNRLRSILVISPQRQYLKRAESWIRRLDAQAEGNEKQLFTYIVQNRRAQDLVDVLQAMFSTETGNKAVAGENRKVAPNYQVANLNSGSQSSKGLMPGSSNFSKGNASTVGSVTNSSAQPHGSILAPSTSSVQFGAENSVDDSRVKIIADDSQNAILIEATAHDYKRVSRVISNLDVMPKQVLIEGIIAEVSLNDDLKFGVRWFLQKHNSNFTFSDAVTGAVSSMFPGFSYAFTAANVARTLNTLSQITDVNVVSSPSLTVMDSKPAVLQIGDQVPVTTQSATGVLTAGAPIVNSISYKDTGVILSIVPRINKSGRVLLDIEQEVSTVAATTTSNINSPTIRQRRIRTSVVVNDGDALLLGGLIQDNHTVTRTQIPILGDIPILGNAVKSKDNEIGKTELIIVIAPHVIRNLTEARRITEEYRTQFSEYGPQRRMRTRSLEQGIRRAFD
ncbi:MAG TPA: type II secretion system secretin GspD [Pseudolabrys sp.]|nr:type II secretion system secretin GspD [Pseudolabrys sp.]